MTRSITFNGQTQYKPGAISKINAQALVPVGLTTNGIVALLGESDGGVPGEIVTIDDPALASSLFRSGPLADAIRLAFDPSNDPRTPGGCFRVLAYKVNASTQSGTQLPGDEAEVSDTAAAGSTTTAVNLTAGGLTVDAHIGRWFTWNGEKRRIVSNTASQVTVSPGFSDAPTALDAVSILESQIVVTSVDYGEHTLQVSIEVEAGTGQGFVVTLVLEDTTEQSAEIGGTSFLDIKYVGGPIEDEGDIDPAGINADGVTITASMDGGAPVASQFDGMVMQFPSGEQRLIDSHTAADPCVFTLNSAHALSAAEQTALDESPITIRNVTQANVSITGASGVATGLSSAVLPTADDLAITFTPGQTLRALVEYINANTNYEAAIPDGVNPDTTLMSSFDFGTRATDVDCRFDDEIDHDNKGSFRRDLQVLVDWINNYSELCTAVKASTGTGEGSELPAWTGGYATAVQDVPVYLTGGARGTSNNSAWQDGFDALLLQRANHVVPLIAEDLAEQGYGSSATWASVAAQLSSHVSYANAAGKNERAGYIGFKGTKAEFIAQAATFNSADLQVLSELHTVLDVDGNLVEQDEWAAAVLAAGMRAGAPEVGTPLTFKYIKTFGVSRDSSWDPKNITDVNQLLAGGCMFSEPGPTGGFRWVRDITTYLMDDNIAFMDGNTRDAVRYVAYDLRTDLENQFTGEKAIPATAANIRERVGAKMQAYRTDNIIVDSLDPENPDDTTTIIPGWRRLRVSISGNVAAIKLEIFPVTGIVFETLEIFLQLPTISG